MDDIGETDDNSGPETSTDAQGIHWCNNEKYISMCTQYDKAPGKKINKYISFKTTNQAINLSPGLIKTNDIPLFFPW